MLIGLLGALILVVACVSGIPWIRFALNTVSRDYAYVNGYVTSVAPRVSGQISRVLVDDNYRVQKGELLAINREHRNQNAERLAQIDRAKEEATETHGRCR